MWRKLAISVLVGAGALLAWQAMPAVPPPLELPIGQLREEAARGSLPYVARALPDWLPLPASGRVIAAGAYPPQPPYGAAVTITVRIDDTPEGFAASYTSTLAAAGFEVRRVAAPFDFTFTTDSALDAYDPSSGRYVFCVLRHNRQNRFAQITFWEPPAPRL